jgi:AAA+ ATPase superfamily predicted ATPase
MDFLNRREELALLERLWGSHRAEFLVLYGRRRVGKTELLAHFASSRRAIFLEAADVRREDQLRDFGAVYADAMDLTAVTPEVRSWEHALEMIAHAVGTDRTLVVLDEFQYLARQQEGLGSLLSRWWRTTGSRLPIVLVLSGSDIAFFGDEVLGATAPLHGRRTADYRLMPFSPSDSTLFLSAWDSEDRIRAYGVWGGIPYYLAMIDDRSSLEENILETILSPGAPLQSEADYLIRMESRLRDVALYGSILRAIASGRTTTSAVADHLGGADLGNVSRQIERLTAVGLVSVARPVVRARRTDARFQIADPFLRFWFRFAAPAGARLATRDAARRYLTNVVIPALDQFVSMPAFEEFCRADLARRFDAATVGRWWGPIQENDRSGGVLRTVDREADGVAVDDDGTILALATCKWTNSPVSVSEVNKLRRIAAHLAPGRAIPLVVYTRSGVGARLAAEHEADPAQLLVVSADDLQP